MKKVFDVSLVNRGFKINNEQYQELKEICEKKGLSVSACIREVILSVNEGKLKPSLVSDNKTNNKLVWVKMSDDCYYQFRDICAQLGYNTFSDCVRDSIISWIDNHKLDQSVPPLVIHNYKRMKGNLVTREVKLSKTDYKKLVSLCNKLGRVSEAKCIREAMLFFLNMLQNDKNIRKFTINNEDGKEPQITIKFRAYREDYYTFYDLCKDAGYKTISECVKDATKVWMKEQEAKIVES